MTEQFISHPKEKAAKNQELLSHAREMLFLAGEAKEGDLPILPGDKWAVHYPQQGMVRAEKLTGLIEGKYKPEEAVDGLKPDALLFNASEIKEHGLPAVSARIREATAYLDQYDYERFAGFVAGFQGKDLELATVQSLYDGISRSRIQKKLLDAYGSTGKQQMETALKIEAKRSASQFANLSGTEKALTALKLNWLCEDFGFFATQDRDQLISRLSKEEKKLFDQLKGFFRNYVSSGQEADYQQLVGGMQERIPAIDKQPEEEKVSESMEDLQKELDPFIDEVGKPGTNEDPAIPPDDEDEYHTPPIQSGESKEQAEKRPIFEIAPSGESLSPLTGYYCSGRKSYYDETRKVWSKKKQLVEYSHSVAGRKRQTISGTLDSGLKALPLPNNYSLDISSLRSAREKPEIFRDQNGCFYIQTKRRSNFSIDFLKSETPFVGAPIDEDTKPIYNGHLSKETELAISNLRGSDLEKALQARDYIVSNHWYPGGGDLQTAQALQHKLRQESTESNYIQNIDASEYLECYSAATLFIAMARKADLPARLVVGHKVEGAKDGKAVIDANTGHAWVEIWNDAKWVRIDPAPNAKPEDKKPDSEKKDSDQTPTEQAEDEGMETPAQQQDADQKKGEQQSGQLESATEDDFQKAESNIKEAEQEVDKVEQTKEELQQQIAEKESAEDLMEMENAISESDLFEDMKEDLIDQLEAKEKQMKDEVEERLEQMFEDGFIDEDQLEKLQEEIKEAELEKLDQLQRQVEEENKLYLEYEEIRKEIEPYVDQWWRYFAEKLPREEEMEIDEDSLSRRGALNKKALVKPRNILFGIVKNPKVISPSVKPKYLASIVVDVSTSMSGEKLKQARKLLVFYNELFGRISSEFGYIRSANYIFSDSVKPIKTFDQDYDSVERYHFDDGTSSTIKTRLMKTVRATGGTNMLEALKKAAGDLNEEVYDYPDYASGLYFVGDGGDTCGNEANIKRFLQMQDTERGFGEHMLSAVLLGDESLRRKLAGIFGEERTTVASSFEDLIEQSMDKFDDDLQEYLRGKVM